MKFAVISDLHTGDKAIAEEFNTDKNSSHAVKKNYLADLKSITQKNNINADYLFVTGDITDQANFEQVELAAKRIQECADIFNVSKDNIYFVPGNHDANWPQESLSRKNGEPEKNIISSKYKYIKENDFFSTILNKSIFGCLYNEPYFTFWSDEKLNIVGINSSVFDSSESDVHHGSIRNTDLNTLDKFLSDNISQEKDKLNILLIHHHAFQHSDLPFNDVDLSILENAGQLIDVITKHSFDFLIHGHKHIPKLDKLVNGFEYPLNILCAGSFSATLDVRYFQGTPNTFHLVEIEEQCPKHLIPKGKVYTFSHLTGFGWENEQNLPYGALYKDVFGSRISRFNLETLLEQLITQLFTFKDHIRFTDLLEINMELGYVQKKLYEVVLTKLNTKLSFDIVWPESAKQLFVLLKN
jgi:3',5'-cyclic AMP phosphodiesterase CpdA